MRSTREARLRATPCTVDGCQQSAASFTPQLCSGHRHRLRKYGTTDDTPVTARKKQLDGDFALVYTPAAKEAGPCWLWSGQTNHNGYGMSRRHGEKLVHRAAWVANYGPIPDGLYACHKCDTPGCYRPSHLFIGSALDNSHDMLEKGRLFAGDGRPDGRLRLTDEQVEDIRAEVAAGEMIVEVARRYGVSKTLVGLIARGRRRPYPTGNIPARPPRIEVGCHGRRCLDHLAHPDEQEADECQA